MPNNFHKLLQKWEINLDSRLDTMVSRHIIEPHDLSEVELDNVACIISFMAWNKVSYLGKPIHHHPNCILPL